jgi:nucleotide-binding universal stress UspA family protein
MNIATYHEVIIPCDAQPDPVSVAVATGVAARLGVPVVLFSLVGAGFERRDEDELIRYARMIGPEVRTRVAVDDGRSTSTQLAEVASEPGTLMCLRTHAEPAIIEAVFGSIGENIIRESTQSLLVVGPKCRAHFPGSTMIVSVDPDFADEAVDVDRLDETRRLAGALGLTPEYVTVVKPGTDAGDQPVERTGAVRLGRYRRKHDRGADPSLRLPGGHPGNVAPGSGATPLARPGAGRIVSSASPARALAHLSERDDVAAIAAETYSTGAFDRLIAGSTTAALIRHSVCPVVTRAIRPDRR